MTEFPSRPGNNKLFLKRPDHDYFKLLSELQYFVVVMHKQPQATREQIYSVTMQSHVIYKNR